MPNPEKDHKDPIEPPPLSNNKLPNRRKFLFALSALILCAIYSFSRLSKILVSFRRRNIDLGEFGGGYASSTSIKKGEILGIFYHSTENIEADLIRLSAQKEFIGSYVLPAATQDGNYDPFTGFDWKNPYQLPQNILKVVTIICTLNPKKDIR